MSTEQLTNADLAVFTGTEQWYRHPVVKNTLYTDGIKFVAQRARAYWLIDEITYQQYHLRIKNEEFQVWTLKVDLEGSTAILTCDDCNDHIIFTKPIGYTGFPLKKIKIYVTNDVILLPSEY
ncbi:DUF6876 family protein [Dyadobacter psychrotolerans]|uniref:DUF6876 domain-containing protein n=1 Tax=Dyadobacter psychrotolerans TaxID=2541721 RepID=A0A4R5DJP7_9BACT|nr:DUF6876 family protein [Dyadobacter psychrotolerans]TDE11045.1 hypothetical protein E0F88_26475 [Dyadobacter psychrotolerans]